jgi:alpha-tubulin suppressor-like RCC1 family protein
MKPSVAGRELHILKHAMRSVLIMSAASLFFSCGSENSDVISAGKANLSKSLAPAVQCSDGATIAAGMYHTVGLKEDGSVVAVGSNGYGQLNVSSWTNITAIAAGAYHTVGLTGDGTVAAVGYTGQGQLNVSPWTNITAIAAGAYHTVGLTGDGTVVAVGYNVYGQLNVSSWTNITAIAAGAYHTVGLTGDGTVVAVGYNGQGQLGVSLWTNITAIAADTYHTVGLKEDGTVVAVGSNGYGQLDVSSWTNMKAIAAGMYHTVGLKEDGTVVAVGSNGYGQLDVSPWTNITAIAADAYHTVGLKEDGTVVAVGYNVYGQLDVSSLFTNIMPICGSADKAIQDTAPPMTTTMITGTAGNNGWYVSDVQMTLTATDNDGGSGVKEIHYSVDGTETIVQGNSASYPIVGDGAHAVIWYAIDNAGTVETPSHEMSINIDKTAPSIPSLVTDPSVLWPSNHKMINVLVGGSVEDGGSGIESTTITVTDEYGIYNMTVPGFGSAIQLESWHAGTDKDGRVYTIAAVATDKAGNQSTETTTVVVPHDACPGPLSEDRRHGHHHRDHDHHDRDNQHDRDHHDQAHRHDHDHHDQAHR